MENTFNNSGNTGAYPSVGAAAAFGMGRPQSSQGVTEDGPSMRAVALSSRPVELQFSSNLGGPRFGKAPPLGLTRPSFTLKGDSKRSTSEGLTIKKEWNEVTVSPCWEVSELEQVPMDFPLERTHREIHGAEAPEVASRISEALRVLSIEAEYDGPKAKAKCRTRDLVSFRIRLYSGGEGGLPVMVEVQRRSGPPSCFMISCRAILDAAEGKVMSSSTVPTSKKLPPFMKGPVGGMKCLEQATLKVDPVADMVAGLNKATELLRSKLKDSNLLGLENFCHLTDAVKTRPDIALKVSKRVLLGDESCDIREEVAVLLQRDTFPPEDFDDEESPTTHAEKSRHLALVMFSNSLALTSKDGCLAAAVKSQKWFADYLIPSLLDEVRSYETSANNAYEAAFGLTSLASCSEVACRLMKDNSAEDELKAARKYGLQHHELLAKEAERCLEAMGFTL